ncbi:MAG: TetR/AcrR family transcriptional regulator [Acidimicrobiales bacterium]
MPPRGRPRDAALDERIAAAVVALLAADGYEALTMEAVAAAANVSKPALYRRHASKASLVFSVVAARGEAMAVPDTGTVAGDLQLALEGFVAFLGAVDRAAVGDGLAQMTSDAEFAGRVQREVFDPDRERMVAVVERAVARGEVRPDVDARALLDDLAGVLVYRILLRHEVQGPAEVAALVDRALVGVLADAR